MPQHVRPFELSLRGLHYSSFSNSVREPVTQLVGSDLLPFGHCCHSSILLHEVAYLVSVHGFEYWTGLEASAQRGLKEDPGDRLQDPFRLPPIAYGRRLPFADNL